MFSLSKLSCTTVDWSLTKQKNNGKGMLFSVEQAFAGRDEKPAPLKTPAWEARSTLGFDGFQFAVTQR